MRITRSFQVGSRPGSRSEQAGAVRLFSARSGPPLREVHAALAHAGHRLGQDGDLRDGSALEFRVRRCARTRVRSPGDARRRPSGTRTAPARPRDRSRRRTGDTVGARRRATPRPRAPERRDPHRRPHPAYVSTSMPFSMRRTRPASTLPGPDLETRVDAPPGQLPDGLDPAHGRVDLAHRAHAQRGRRRSRGRRPRWSRPAGARRRRGPPRAAASGARAPAP